MQCVHRILTTGLGVAGAGWFFLLVMSRAPIIIRARPTRKAQKPMPHAMKFSEVNTTMPAASVSRNIPAPRAVQFLEPEGLRGVAGVDKD